jgi:predicted nuclease with TOPRIM domain
MTSEPAADVVRWVQEGERLFGRTLQTLHRYQEIEEKAEKLAVENARLEAEIQQLRTERLEAAESLKAIAEHVTRLATVALQRLGKPVG